MLWTQEAQPQQILTIVMTHIVVDKSIIQTTLNHIRFVLPQYQRQKKSGFSKRDHEHDTLSSSSIVWTLIDNGKLANQIAKAVAMCLA